MKTCIYKMGGRMPQLSGSVVDEKLKSVCRIAGINDIITVRRYSGNNEIITKKKKYQLVTFHTARHTFISVMLNAGVPQSAVMKMTGITSPKTLMRYLSTQVEDVERALKRVSIR